MKKKKRKGVGWTDERNNSRGEIKKRKTTRKDVRRMLERESEWKRRRENIRIRWMSERRIEQIKKR